MEPENTNQPTGQAPNADPGQAPTPQTPTPQAGSTAKSADEYEKMIADLRKENAGHRTKLTAFEKAQQEAEAAKLDDLTRTQKAYEKAQTQLKALQDRAVAYEVQLQATQLGIHDPDAAAKLIDSAALEVDDNGIPTNAKELLEKLIKAKPYLVASSQTPRPNPGTSNPGRGNGTPSAGGLSREIIQNMPQADRITRHSEIMDWLSKQNK